MSGGFDQIIGQKRLINILKQSIENKTTVHAYAFCGPSGIGKKTVSKIFASYLLCSKNSNCGVCLGCKTLSQGSNNDFMFIDKEKSISIDDIREIQKHLLEKPLYSDKKVYIINNADTMTVQAQNCLLKTLEEPPSYVVIILLVNNFNTLIETVRSRAMKINFQRNTHEELKEILTKEGITQIEEFLINYADGIPGRAMKIYNDLEFIEMRNELADIFKSIDNFDIFKAEKLILKYKDYKDNMFDILISFFRDCLIIKFSNQNQLINPDKKDIILSNINKKTYSLLKCIKVILKSRTAINRNTNFNLAINVMLTGIQEACING